MIEKFLVFPRGEERGPPLAGPPGPGCGQGGSGVSILLARPLNYQWVSAKHLKRYLGEFDFRYNTRHVTDFERAAIAAKGIQGKRLTYRRTGLGAHV